MDISDKDFSILDKFRKNLEWKDPDTFIKDIKSEQWLECEAIINPKGQVAYAIQGHVQSLITYSGETSESIYSKMNIFASPIHWLVEYTSCASVWSCGVILPKNITSEQEFALKRLSDESLISMQQFL